MFWNGLTLFLVLAVIGFLTWAGTVFLMARTILCPPRMTDGKAVYVLERLSPGDLGMAFEELTFDIRDKASGKPLKIAGWWIPHPNRQLTRCVVLIHGYADAKVGALAWAPLWRELGYHILAIDLRAHGYSGGRYTTGGFFERHDLDEVINRVRAEREGQTREMVLFGVSLGAAVAIGTAAMREDIAAIILDCPFNDYETAVRRHGYLMHMPGSMFTGPALRLAQWISGADFASVRPTELLRKVPCPALIIQSAQDELVPDQEASAYKPTASDKHAVWRIPEAGHVLGLPANPEAYRMQVEQFLAQTVQLDAVEDAGDAKIEVKASTDFPTA